MREKEEGEVRRYFVMFFALVCSIIFAASAYAEHIFGPDELDTTYGAAFRLRQEIWENAFDLDTGGPASQNRNFFRLKTNLWANLDYDKKIGLKVALTNEAKYYLDVSSFRPVSGSRSRFDEDELLFDNLYVDMYLQKLAGLPVSLRIGRQDFLFTHGEGFLILDGTPGDGSRTFYFDAAKANIKFNENHNLDLIYISNQMRDTYLPVLHSPRPPFGKVRLNTSDEQGFVVYSRNKLTKEFSIEPYYIFKEEDPFGANRELDLNTLGLRAVYASQGWRVRAEFAHQFGEYDNGRDRKANGGYIFVGRKYDSAPMKPEFDLGYLYLSGDDPNTAKHEGWNPLFNRCPFVGPVYSELFIFTLTRETGADSALPAYWTNLHIVKANAKVNVAEKTRLSLAYHYLWADEKTKFTTPPNSAMFSNDSKDRGHLLQGILSHVFSKKVDGVLHFEYFIPGNFYADRADDALFFRWQLQIKI
jgi:hypothetical protein